MGTSTKAPKTKLDSSQVVLASGSPAKKSRKDGHQQESATSSLSYVSGMNFCILGIC